MLSSVARFGQTIFAAVVFISAPYIWAGVGIVDRWLTWGFGKTSAERRRNAVMLLCIWLLISAVGLALGGCAPSFAPHSGAANALIDQTISNGVKDIKDANDRFRIIASEAQCAVTLGAFGREQDLLKSWGMLAMCPEAMAKMSALTTGVPMPTIPRFPAPDAPSPASP